VPEYTSVRHTFHGKSTLRSAMSSVTATSSSEQSGSKSMKLNDAAMPAPRHASIAESLWIGRCVRPR